MPIFTQGFVCVTLTKRFDMVLDSEGAVYTPHDAHVGCEKLKVKTENAEIWTWEKWWFKASW